MSHDSFEKIHRVAASVSNIIIGKQEQIRLALTCILASGHLLIEDVPGVGKTTLSHALAAALGLKYARLQFTSDMLPSDVTGSAVFDREKGEFVFHPGPVFTQVLLADEINRATPKTQSALLEAMEERQVTTEGVTRPLPEPFFVIATQNPASQIGTFPLPESQLDRFLMTIALGYPDSGAEEALLLGEGRRDMLQSLAPAIASGELQELQAAAAGVHVSKALAQYVLRILTLTREGGYVTGLSPRAGLGLLRAARAWAAISGHQHVSPEDVQAVFAAVAGHRLHPISSAAQDPAAMCASILRSVPV